jgi:heterodisulfide reductase subunit A
VTGIQGGLGHYTLDLNNGEPVTAGAIVVATGSEVFDADRIAEYRYHLPEVLNSYDLSQLLARQDEGLLIKADPEYTPKNIHFIQCVGSRDENYNPYCTLICCTIGVKQALELKTRLPDANVYVHYMDMRGPYPGFEEKFIEAQDAGVTFSRGRIGDILPAENAEEGRRLNLRGESVELGEVFSWPADLVVLSVGHQPSEGANDLANMMFFPKDRDSFNVEHNYHIDLKDRRGIIFVGTAQGPRFMHHSLHDARRGAHEIAEFFNEKVLSRDVRSVIAEERCAGCGTCVELCPYEAINLRSVIDYDRNVSKRIAVVDINQCQGCGACAAGCPSGVPTLQKYSTEQLWRQIEEMI